MFCSLTLTSSSGQVEDADIQVKQPENCIDFAAIEYGGTYHASDVENVKVLCRVAVLLLCLIPYWIIYAQVRLLSSFRLVKLFVTVKISQYVLDFKRNGMFTECLVSDKQVVNLAYTFITSNLFKQKIDVAKHLWVASIKTIFETDGKS